MAVSVEFAQVLQFRPANAGDMAFVYDSWIKCWRESPWAGVVRNNDIYEVTRSVIQDLLARGAKIEVACARHDETRILGWACTERIPNGFVAHFVYIKDPFRRRGLASELLERAHGPSPVQGLPRLYYTFRTRGSAHFPGWTHCPEIARRK